MLHQQLREDWLTRLRGGSIDLVPRFAEQGVILGNGTVLLARDGSGRRLQQVRGQEARLLALLSAACGEVLPGRVIGNIERAAKCWSEGDDCFAYIHLAHARLPLPRDTYASMCRLLVAESAMTAGVPPQAILQALKTRIPDIDLAAKFDPNEPRVPAGSGPTSGQWADSDETANAPAADQTSGEGTADEGTQGPSLVARMPLPTSSFLGGLDAAQAAELGAYALRLIGPVGAATAAFGLLFVPSPNDLRIEGEVEGIPGLRYSWNQDETLLGLTYAESDGSQRTFALSVDGDLIRDKDGQVVGRIVGGNRIAIDTIAVLPDVVKQDEPRLCPAPNPTWQGATKASHTRKIEADNTKILSSYSSILLPKAQRQAALSTTCLSRRATNKATMIVRTRPGFCSRSKVRVLRSLRMIFLGKLRRTS